MVNKIWTVLDGTFEDVHPDGDWRRYTSNDIFIPNEKRKLASNVFNDADPHIRGWLVESALRIALQSSYRYRLLEQDPLNTYDIPLNGEKNKVTIDNPAVTYFVIDNSETSPVYEDILKCTFDIAAKTVTVNGKPYAFSLTDNVTNPLPLTVDKSFIFMLPPNDITVTLTVKRVYSELAATILQNRIRALLNTTPIREVNNAENTVELIGSFVWQLM